MQKNERSNNNHHFANYLSSLSALFQEEQTKLKRFRKNTTEWNEQYDKVIIARNNYFDSLKKDA